MGVRPVTKDEFQDILANESKTILLNFSANWCMPCKMMAPILDEVANEHSDEIVICKVNVEEHPDLAALYKVRSIPTFVSFKNGDVYKHAVGAMQKAGILDLVE